MINVDDLTFYWIHTLFLKRLTLSCKLLYAYLNTVLLGYCFLSPFVEHMLMIIAVISSVLVSNLYALKKLLYTVTISDDVVHRESILLALCKFCLVCAALVV